MTSVFAAPSWEVANIRLENRAEGGLRARVVLPGGGAADRATAEVSVIALAFASSVPTHAATPGRSRTRPAPQPDWASLLVPGMLSRHGRTTLFTDDFWNVRHICNAADSNDRVSVVARAAPPGNALFPSASSTTPTSRTTVREVFLQVRSKPDAQAPPGRLSSSPGSCSSPEEARHGSVGLEPQHGGNELVAVVGRAALALAAAADPVFS